MQINYFRAMRNRGVEIYMRGPEEESFSTLDSKALLAHSGVYSHCEQQTLISVYEALGTGTSGTKKSSFNIIFSFSVKYVKEGFR